MLALSTIQCPLQTGGRGEDSGCLVTVPNNSGAGLGEKETLCVYRPLLLRHKSSFFRQPSARLVFVQCCEKICISFNMDEQKSDTRLSHKPKYDGEF